MTKLIVENKLRELASATGINYLDIFKIYQNYKEMSGLMNDKQTFIFDCLKKMGVIQ